MYIARYSIPVDYDDMIFCTSLMSQTLKLMILLNLLKTMMMMSISLPKLSLRDIVNVARRTMLADTDMETKDVVVVGEIEVEENAPSQKSNKKDGDPN